MLKSIGNNTDTCGTLKVSAKMVNGISFYLLACLWERTKTIPTLSQPHKTRQAFQKHTMINDIESHLKDLGGSIGCTAPVTNSPKVIYQGGQSGFSLVTQSNFQKMLVLGGQWALEQLAEKKNIWHRPIMSSDESSDCFFSKSLPLLKWDLCWRFLFSEIVAPSALQK